MIDLFFRSFSRARWITVATARGIYDADGNIQPGFGVDELGNVVVTPAVLNPDGSVQTPAVVDTWWSVNLRLSGNAADADDDTLYPGDTDTGFKFNKSKLARWVRAQAAPVTVAGIRGYQFGTGNNRVQLLDTRDITTPARVWAGGMSF